jgi:hypothetical protein
MFLDEVAVAGLAPTRRTGGLGRLGEIALGLVVAERLFHAAKLGQIY